MFIWTIGDAIGLAIWGFILTSLAILWGVGKVQDIIRRKRRDRT